MVSRLVCSQHGGEIVKNRFDVNQILRAPTISISIDLALVGIRT